jgi:hypothetical protein
MPMAHFMRNAAEAIGSQSLENKKIHQKNGTKLWVKNYKRPYKKI